MPEKGNLNQSQADLHNAVIDREIGQESARILRQMVAWVQGPAPKGGTFEQQCVDFVKDFKRQLFPLLQEAEALFDEMDPAKADPAQLPEEAPAPFTGMVVIDVGPWFQRSVAAKKAVNQ